MAIITKSDQSIQQLGAPNGTGGGAATWQYCLTDHVRIPTNPQIAYPPRHIMVVIEVKVDDERLVQCKEPTN